MYIVQVGRRWFRLHVYCTDWEEMVQIACILYRLGGDSLDYMYIVYRLGGDGLDYMQIEQVRYVGRGWFRLHSYCTGSGGEGLDYMCIVQVRYVERRWFRLHVYCAGQICWKGMVQITCIMYMLDMLGGDGLDYMYIVQVRYVGRRCLDYMHIVQVRYVGRRWFRL